MTIMRWSRSYWMLLLFVLLVAAVAMIGAQFQPGDWYKHLEKPFWTPPNWVFPMVWSILYLMIAIAGWLIFSTTNSMLKVLWGVQLVLNGLWSWLFFGMHQVGLGLLDIMAVLACITMLVMRSRQTQKSIYWLMAPYLLWVAYATTLNAAIFILNPAGIQ